LPENKKEKKKKKRGNLGKKGILYDALQLWKGT